MLVVANLAIVVVIDGNADKQFREENDISISAVVPNQRSNRALDFFITMIDAN